MKLEKSNIINAIWEVAAGIVGMIPERADGFRHITHDMSLELKAAQNVKAALARGEASQTLTEKVMDHQEDVYFKAPDDNKSDALSNDDFATLLNVFSLLSKWDKELKSRTLPDTLELNID